MSYSLTRVAERDRDQIVQERARQAGVGAALRLDDEFERIFELIGGTVSFGVKKRHWTSGEYWFVLVDHLYWVIWHDHPEQPAHRVVARILYAESEDYKRLQDLL